MKNTIPRKAIVVFPDMTVVPPEEAKISAFDRSFHFGDSLYEVTRSYDGVLFALEEHMQRLKKSCELAMFEEMPDFERIARMMRHGARSFFRAFGNTDVYVRVIVSRGISDLNIDRRCSSEPYAMVFVKEIPALSPDLYERGMHYAVVSRRRNPPNALNPAMKSGNYLNNILALSEAQKQGASDAILVNQQGFVTEGTTNNVYCVKDGEVWTAPLSVGILAGITRQWIFELCDKESIPCKERLFTESDLLASQEMFLTSSIKEVMSITTLNGRSIGDGKPGLLTKKLHVALTRSIADYISAHKGETLFI